MVSPALPDTKYEGNTTEPEIIIKPKYDSLIQFGAVLGLLALVGFGSFYYIKSSQPIPEPDQKIASIPAKDIAIEPDAMPSPEPSPEVENIDTGVDIPSQKMPKLEALNSEITKQVNNQFYARRNYFLRKANDSLAKQGKSIEYHLLLELGVIREKIKTLLLQNNSKALAGIGGEFTGNASDSLEARALLGDAQAIALALTYIYQLPAEAKPDPDALVTRPQVGTLLKNLVAFEIEARTEIQDEVWQVIEQANQAEDQSEAMTEQHTELKETLKK